MQVERGCDARRLALVDDLHRALRRSQGVVAKHDAQPAQRRVNLVEAAVERDRTGLADLACGLEQEHRFEIDLRPGMPDALAALHPFLLWRQLVEPAVGCQVVLSFQPGPVAPVQCLQAARVGRLQPRQELRPCGPEMAFDLALPGRMEGTRVDQCRAQRGADHGQMPATEAGAEVHVQAPGDAPALHRLAQHLQERRSPLVEVELAVGDDPGGVVEGGEQVGLAQTPALVADCRSVQAVGLPEITGKGECEPPQVLLWPLLLADHQPLAGEQPVQGRGRQRNLRRHGARLPRLPDHLADAQFGSVRLDRQHRLDHFRRHPPRLRAVAAALRQQPLEAALPVEPEPVVDRPFRNPHPAAAGNLPHFRGLHPDQRCGAIRRLVQNRRQNLEPEQRYRLPVLFPVVRHPSSPLYPLHRGPELARGIIFGATGRRG